MSEVPLYPCESLPLKGIALEVSSQGVDLENRVLPIASGDVLPFPKPSLAFSTFTEVNSGFLFGFETLHPQQRWKGDLRETCIYEWNPSPA